MKSSSAATTADGLAASPTRLADSIATWAASERRISRATLERLGVASGTAFFPDLGRKSEAIVFRYREGWKARAVPEKSFVAGKGLKLSFWGEDDALASVPETVFVVEGELDRCAMVEAGIPAGSVLSVPNGARQRTSEAPVDMRGYSYVDEALKAGLNRVKKFVWCGDTDDAGLALRADMARLLGVARFWFVDWPDGCKDANDMLRTDGARDLRELVTDGALQWPVTGLYRLSELPEPPPLTLWHPGFTEWESKVRLAPRTLSVVTGHPNHGKALALDTLIPTPSGWTTMGDVQVGDIIFDEQGEQCRVRLATPVMLNHDCYRVTFDDGSEIIADADHLWLTETEAARQSEYAWRRRGSRNFLLPHGTDQSNKRTYPGVATTRDIANSLIVNGKRNHAVRLCEPIRTDDVDLPIPPYVLGVWLGDGDSVHATIACADADSEIMQHVAADGVPIKRAQYGDRTPTWSLSDGVRSPVKDSVKGRLRKLRLLNNKHIPSSYLRASVEQRSLLLQGLMDTDGYIGADGQAEFCNTNRSLAHGVYELVCSLGIRARILSGRAKLYGIDCGEKYRVLFSTTYPIFRLARKRDKQIICKGRRKYRYIDSCEPVDTVPVRCIQVDSPSRLYLVGKSFIPTHNTLLWTQIFFQIVQAYHLVLFTAAFETRPKPHIRRQLRTLVAGQLERDMNDDARRKADAWINDHYLFAVHPEHRQTLEWFLDLAEIAIVRHGAKIVTLDPWNRLEGSRERHERDDEYIARCLRTLYVFATDMNCHVQIVAHPAKMDGHRKGTPPMLEDISGAKHWDNMVDQGFTVHRPEMFDGVNRKTEAVLYHRKSRFDELGYPCKLGLQYDLARGRYRSTDYDTGGYHA